MTMYRITERAGPFVAGVRVTGIAPGPDGLRRVELSDAAAQFDLVTGAIEEDRPAARTKRPAREPLPVADGEPAAGK